MLRLAVEKEDCKFLLNTERNPSTDEQIAAIRRDYGELRFSFHPVETYVNSKKPRIRRMVSKLVETGFPPVKISAL